MTIFKHFQKTVLLSVTMVLTGCAVSVSFTQKESTDIRTDWNIVDFKGVIQCRVQAVTSLVLMTPKHCYQEGLVLKNNSEKKSWSWSQIDTITSSGAHDYVLLDMKGVLQSAKVHSLIERQNPKVHWANVYAKQTLIYKDKKVQVLTQGRSLWVQSTDGSKPFCPSDSGTGFYTQSGALAGILISGGSLQYKKVEGHSGANKDLQECYSAGVMLPMFALSWRPHL